MIDTPAPSTRPALGTVVRLGAALAVFVSGLVHLQLYFDGYRDFPDANLGRSFLLSAIVSVVVAIGLVARREVAVRLAAIVLLVGTLAAFVLSRTDRGIFGFTESGLNPSPQTALALILEIVGLVLLAVTFLPAVGPGDRLAVAPVAVAAGLAVVVAIGGAVLWAGEEDRTATSPAPTTAPPTVPAATSTMPATTSTTSAPDEPTTTRSGAATTDAPTTTAVTTTPPTTVAPAAANVVSIADFAFDAPMLEVPVGTTVEWVNNDSFAHSVVAEDGSFQSEDLASGDRFSFTFSTPGSFAYLCGIHPSMRGTIVVTG